MKISYFCQRIKLIFSNSMSSSLWLSNLKIFFVFVSSYVTTIPVNSHEGILKNSFHYNNVHNYLKWGRNFAWKLADSLACPSLDIFHSKKNLTRGNCLCNATSLKGVVRISAFRISAFRISATNTFSQFAIQRLTLFHYSHFSD